MAQVQLQLVRTPVLQLMKLAICQRMAVSVSIPMRPLPPASQDAAPAAAADADALGIDAVKDTTTDIKDNFL